MTERNSSIGSSFLAGGIAGLNVDIVLYPLDTIKTRLQSGQGFIKSGGFRGIYSGLASVTAGSIPSAAFFFCSYDAIKNLLKHDEKTKVGAASIHVVAASVGEVAACVVRVPVEVIKQRTQTNTKFSSLQMFHFTLKSEGIKGLYRGYTSTVLKDVPFSLIQFPLWEYFKAIWSEKQNKELDSWQAAVCGAFAGGIAAATTTPLDVAKTRIMLAQKNSDFAQGKILAVLQKVYFENGMKSLFAGLMPRVTAISIGGAIFLGVYDKAIKIISR